MNCRYAFVTIIVGTLGMTAGLCTAIPVSSAEAITSVSAVSPGDTFTLGLQFTMQAGWHTYAEEPGDSGMPPEIEILSPQKLKSGSWLFPPAQTFTDETGTTYGYEKKVILLNDIHIPEQTKSGETISIELKITWMVCKDTCLPISTTLKVNLPIKDKTVQTEKWQTILESGGWSADQINKKTKSNTEE